MSLSRFTFSALATSSLILVSALPATAQTVPQSSHCSIGSSDYLEMPDGGCMDLFHLSVLGTSQENMEAASLVVLDALEANDYTARSYREVYNSKDSYSSRSFSVQPNPTEEQIEENRQYLENSTEQLVEVADIHAEIAERAFIRQTRALTGISGTMAGE